jgi:hypothetical protein
MKHTRWFFWYTPRETLVNVLEICFWAALLAVLAAFHNIAAVVVVGVVLVIMVLYQMRLVAVTAEEVMQIRWGRVDCRIPLKELYRLDTKAAGKGVTACLYGQRDLLELPYREKTVKAVLEALDVDTDAIRSFLREDETYTLKLGEWTLLCEQVLLDGLFEKKPFVHRCVYRTVPQEQEDEETSGSET